MLDAAELAAVMAANTKKSDITLDEIEAIVKYYIKLHNRLYETKWNEEEYLTTFFASFAKKRSEHLQTPSDL